jgi:hypothetical protein
MAAQSRGSVKVLVQPTEGFVGGDGDAVVFLPFGEDLEQQLGAALVQFHVSQFVDLCGCPHRSTYADTGTMRSKSAWPFSLCMKRERCCRHSSSAGQAPWLWEQVAPVKGVGRWRVHAGKRAFWLRMSRAIEPGWRGTDIQARASGTCSRIWGRPACGFRGRVLMSAIWTRNGWSSICLTCGRRVVAGWPGHAGWFRC